MNKLIEKHNFELKEMKENFETQSSKIDQLFDEEKTKRVLLQEKYENQLRKFNDLDEIYKNYKSEKDVDLLITQKRLEDCLQEVNKAHID